jgi:hypothetical protein
LFEQVANAEPASATVCAFWSSAILYEILARQGTLQSQLFVTSNEFLRHQHRPPGTALSRRLAAGDAAQRRLQRNPTDVDGLFAWDGAATWQPLAGAKPAHQGSRGESPIRTQAAPSSASTHSLLGALTTSSAASALPAFCLAQATASAA